ncbi:MAG: thioredoxin [Bacteroidales bacterium]
MKKTIIAQLLIILVFVAFNGKTFAQKAEKPADEKVKIITDQDFDKTIKKGITMIDFWATWCGPCRRQAPIVEEIANEVSKKIKIGKLDVDKNKIASNTYSVRNIPTLIFFKDGKEVKRLVGLQEKQAILNELNALK